MHFVARFWGHTWACTVGILIRLSVLPGHQQQRQVPRANDGDHAARRAHLKRFGGHVFDGVGEDFEVGRTTRDVDVRGQVRGFAIFIRMRTAT